MAPGKHPTTATAQCHPTSPRSAALYHATATIYGTRKIASMFHRWSITTLVLVLPWVGSTRRGQVWIALIRPCTHAKDIRCIWRRPDRKCMRGVQLSRQQPRDWGRSVHLRFLTRSLYRQSVSLAACMFQSANCSARLTRMQSRRSRSQRWHLPQRYDGPILGDVSLSPALF